MSQPYSYRSGDSNFDSRARTPTKGLRLKLRTKLRAIGVTGKFRTDELRITVRGKTVLVVMGAVSDTSLAEFEGHQIRYRN